MVRVSGGGLEQWEKERGTTDSISPGTKPLLTPDDLREDKYEELDTAEIASQIRDTQVEGAQGATLGSDQEFSEQVARREAAKPQLVRRDMKGTHPGETRKRYHPSYRGEN